MKKEFKSNFSSVGVEVNYEGDITIFDQDEHTIIFVGKIDGERAKLIKAALKYAEEEEKKIG